MVAVEKYFGERGRDLRRVFKRKTFQVQRLWDTHQEIIRQSVLGMKGTEIANALGVSSAMVSYTLNSPIVREKKALLQTQRDAKTVDLAVRIREFAPKCIQLLEEVVGGQHKEASIGLRVRTAQDYADRAGFGAVKKFQVATAHLTRDDLEEIKDRARQNGIVRQVEVVNAT